MSAPTDMLTTVIERAVERTVERLLTPYLERLEASQAQSLTSPDDLLTTKDVETLTGIADSTLRRWRSDKDPKSPPFVHIGAAVRYRRRDLETWIHNQSA